MSWLKTLIVGLIGVVMLGSADLRAQGIEFFEGTWQEALEAAKAEEKLIFVDGYAVWCGPCKRMAKNVFPQEEVGAFYNEKFINVKMDMEKGEGLTFREKYPIEAFPTLYYIDYTGELVHKVKGAQSAEGLIKLGEVALSKIDRSQAFAEQYEAGERDPELVYNYVKELNRAGKPSLAIANEYLRNQADLTTEQNLRFILEAAVEADSRIFGLLIEHRDAIEALEGPEAVYRKIEKACANTLDKAVEFQTELLLEEAKSKMAEYHSKDVAQRFAVEADVAYYLQSGDPEALTAAYRKWTKELGKERPVELVKAAKELSERYANHEGCQKEAIRMVETALKVEEDYRYYYAYAQILARAGEQKDAVKAAEKAVKKAEPMGEGAVQMAQQLLERLQSNS
jgi:thiol-disulfide isomerase/thioredoxin